MALERRRPLPAGRYWLDVFPRNKQAWELWSSSMAKLGSLRVEKTQHFDASGGNEAYDFVIFETSTPNVAWGALNLPHPTIAPSNVQSSEDTVTKPPPPPGVFEQIDDTVKSIGTGAKIASGVLVGVAALALVVVIVKR
jgi:hypothetical protein